MHPVACKWLARHTLGLGDLILVMWEHKITAAAMNIDLLAQMLEVHGRALNMPARSPRSPRAIPEWLAGFGTLPQRKICRMFLALIQADAIASNHIVQAAPRELAIFWIGRHPEIDIVAQYVGVFMLD